MREPGYVTKPDHGARTFSQLEPVTRVLGYGFRVQFRLFGYNRLAVFGFASKCPARRRTIAPTT